MVSLVSAGANEQPALLKAEDGAVCIQALCKADVEGLLYTIPYLPNKPDAHGDWMGPEDVRFAAHAHMRAGAVLDLHHDLVPLTKEQAYPVESSILAAQDPRYPTHDRFGKEIDHRGAWGMVIKLEDPSLLALAKAGKLTEVSLYAPAGAYEATQEDPIAKSEEPMDEEKLAALFAAALAKALEPLAKALEKGEPPKPEPPTEPKPETDANGAPIFKGSLNNPLDVLAHQRRVEDHQLALEFAGHLSDPEALKELVKCQRALAEARAEEDRAMGIAVAPGQSLRKRLAERSSGTPATPSAGGSGTWMQPSDKSAHTQILEQAKALLKSKNNAKEDPAPAKKD